MSGAEGLSHFCRKSWSWSRCWEQGCCVGLHWLLSFLRGSTRSTKKSLKVEFTNTVAPECISLRTTRKMFLRLPCVKAKLRFNTVKPVSQWKTALIVIMSENSEYCLSQFCKVQGNVLKLPTNSPKCKKMMQTKFIVMCVYCVLAFLAWLLS